MDTHSDDRGGGACARRLTPEQEEVVAGAEWAHQDGRGRLIAVVGEHLVVGGVQGELVWARLPLSETKAAALAEAVIAAVGLGEEWEVVGR